MKLLHTWNMLIIEHDIGFVNSTFHRNVFNFEAAGLPLKWLNFLWKIASIRMYESCQMTVLGNIIWLKTRTRGRQV